MSRILSLVVALFSLAACAANALTFRVGGKEVLGSEFILCKSRVRWDGLNINVEGLDLSPNQAATAKSFKVAKLGVTPIEVRKLDNMALLIDGWFVDKCNSAILLSHKPELAAFLEKTATQTTDMMRLLAQLESINQTSNCSIVQFLN